MRISVRHIIRLLSIWAALLSFAVACGEPVENGTFVKQSERTPEAEYEFSVDLSDSLSRHALYFYTVIDASADTFENMPGVIPLQVEAVSPSGRTYRETVGMDKNDCIGGSLHSKQYEHVYRSGFSPVEYGIWTVRIAVPGEERFPGLRGFGLRHVKI